MNFQRLWAQPEGLATDTQQAIGVDAVGGFSAPDWQL
jgi:hypothetical protein